MREQARENRKKWVEALRSGDYKQGRFRLRSSWDEEESCRYCCLGVACDVYKKLTGRGEWVLNSTGDHFFDVDGFLADIGLPNAVAEFFDVTRVGIIAGESPPADALPQVNDELRLEFAAIADIIEDEGRLVGYHEQGE